MTKKKESTLKNDISKKIAETKKVLTNAQKSLAEKAADIGLKWQEMLGKTSIKANG